MSQDLKQTIIDYFGGRLTPTLISEIQNTYASRYHNEPRRAFVSQVFHYHKSSSKVWECIREVAMRQKTEELESLDYLRQ